MSSYNETCDLAEAMIMHVGIVLIHFAVFFVCLSGCVANALILYAISSYRVLQVNLRMLICCLSAIIFMRSLSCFVRSCYFLDLRHSVMSGTIVIDGLLYHHDPGPRDCTSIIWVVWRCKAYSNIISVPGMATGYAFLGIALERIIALAIGKNYEDFDKPLLGVLVAFVVWFEYLYTLITESCALIRDLEPNDGFLPYCTSVSPHVFSMIDLLLQFRLIPIAILSLILFTGIYLYARRHNRRIAMLDHQHSLNGRFLSRVTIKSTRLIIPCAFVYYMLYLFALMGGLGASKISANGNLILGTIVKELCSLAFNSYSILFPLILWRRERGLRFSPFPTPNAGELNEPPVSEHFDISASMWETPVPQRDKTGSRKVPPLSRLAGGVCAVSSDKRHSTES